MADAKRSKLTIGIETRLHWCIAHPGDANKRQYDLPSGLTIVIYVDGGGRRHVLLSRRGKEPPSAREAQTVLEHWPEPVATQVDWVPHTEGKFKCLIGMWPAPAAQLSLTGTKH